jgi:hypothetical protein
MVGLNNDREHLRYQLEKKFGYAEYSGRGFQVSTREIL